MADQLRWWKLWTAALTDPDLERLSLDDWARWARLGALTTTHGDHGVYHAKYPATALVESLRVGGSGGIQRHGKRVCWDTLITTLRRLPNIVVVVEGEGDAQSVIVTWKNWKKYQEDSSVQRTRTWRAKQRERDGLPASQRDGSQAVTDGAGRDDLQASHVTVQTRRDETRTPLPPVGSTTNGAVAFPPEMFNTHGCSIIPGTGRPWPPRTCVSRAYLAEHPDITDFPSLRDGSPKTCEAHQ